MSAQKNTSSSSSEITTKVENKETKTTITVEDLMDLILPELLTEFSHDTLRPYIIQLENTPWLLNKEIANFDEFLHIINRGTFFFPDLKIVVNSIILKASKIFSFITNDDDEDDDDDNEDTDVEIKNDK